LCLKLRPGLMPSHTDTPWWPLQVGLMGGINPSLYYKPKQKVSGLPLVLIAILN
jgi:hypothetical protein